MTDCEDSLTVVNAGPEIERACAWLDRFAGRAALPADVTARLQVALDEVLTNIFVHGLRGTRAGARQVGLGLRRRAGRVELEVTDDGPEFDPTRAEPDRTGVRIAERRAGGVGLLFVRALIDDVYFARQDGRNRLVLAMRLRAMS